MVVLPTRIVALIRLGIYDSIARSPDTPMRPLPAAPANAEV